MTTPSTRAQRAFDALPTDRKLLLLQRVFEVMEYDEDGNPGGEWSSDTTTEIGGLFNTFGVIFTNSDEFDDDTATETPS